MKRKKWVLPVGSGICLLGIALAMLLYLGTIQLNNPSKVEYPVRGVDVSSYQGQIDWDTLGGQGIQFAFIKATEGSSHVDTRFQENWLGAWRTELRIGAYHFFSFDSGGEAQAAHFIATVPAEEKMLPPVVDIEFYGDKEKNPPDPGQVRGELQSLLAALEKAYGRRPILYATKASYDLYLANEFGGYDIWIRDVMSIPRLADGREWTFWQYSNRVRLEGYRGKERFIDMNVFAGTAEEFEGYGVIDDSPAPSN